jgi:dTDP-4-dehydrorhamnose 3,5-epimerase and related enzymes
MPKGGFREVQNIHHTTVGEIVKLLNKFKDSRANLSTEDVGVGFTRAMYSTYLSYLEPDDFKYEITNHNDARGSFAEMLKTNDSGQISFFSAKPGVIRGGHYHHTKTEKFLVIKGNAKFRFENILTKEYKEILVSGDLPEIVDTSPGWSHDIQNIGKDEMFVMLWANECFDQDNPDTIAYEINNE